MNLATITALINSKIRNKTPKVLKVEHADVEQAIVNEIYSDYKPEIITGGVDAPANTIINVISSSSSNYFSASFDFKISGKSCHVKGYFFMNSTSTYSSQPLFEFIDPLYMPKIEFTSQIGGITSGARVVRLKRVGNEIQSVQALPPYETIYVDAIYEIEN